MFPYLFFFYPIPILALSGYSGGRGLTIFSLPSDQKCDKFNLDSSKEREWRGTILQVPLATVTQHKTCHLIIRTQSMYCTYYNNPTQLERVTDDPLL